MTTNQTPVPDGLTPAEPRDLEHAQREPAKAPYIAIVTTMDLDVSDEWREPFAYSEVVFADSPAHAKALAEKYAIDLARGDIRWMTSEADCLPFAEMQARLFADNYYLGVHVAPLARAPSRPGYFQPISQTRYLVSVPTMDLAAPSLGREPDVFTGILDAVTLEEAKQRAEGFAVSVARESSAWLDKANGRSFEATQDVLKLNGFLLGYPVLERLAHVPAIPVPGDADTSPDPTQSPPTTPGLPPREDL